MPFDATDSHNSGPSGDRVVALLEPPEQKIAVIKAVRLCTELGLKDAKELVERAPTPVLANVLPEEAERLYRLLIEAGAKVKIDSADRYSGSDLEGVPTKFVEREPPVGCLTVGAGLICVVALVALLG